VKNINGSNSKFKLKSELEGKIKHLAYFYNSNHDVIKLISEVLEKMPNKLLDILVYIHSDSQKPNTELKKEDYEINLDFQELKKIVKQNKRLSLLYLDTLPNQTVPMILPFARNVIFSLEREQEYIIMPSNKYINTCYFSSEEAKEQIFRKAAKHLSTISFRDVTKKHEVNPLNKYDNANLLLTKTHAFAYADILEETETYLRKQGFKVIKIEDKYKDKFYDLDTLITMYSDNELFISEVAPRTLKKNLKKQGMTIENYPVFKYINSKNEQEELIGDINVLIEKTNNENIVYIPKRTYLLNVPERENYLEYLEQLKELWRNKRFNPVEIECDVKPYVGLRCIFQCLQRETN